MKRLKSFFVLFLTVLLNVYFVNTLVLAEESGEVIIEGTLTTDKENYSSEDPITITLEAKNKAATSTSYESEIVVLDGYVLADNNSNKKIGSLDTGTADSLVVTIVPKSKTGSNTNEQQDNNNPTGQTTSGQSQQPGKGKGSNTGVQNNKTIWIILGTAGALGIIALAIKGKKGKETLSIILCLALAGSIVAANTNQVKAEGYDQEVKVATNVTIDGKTAEINGVIRFNSANQPTPDPQPVVDIPQETFIKDFNPDDVIELEPGIEIMKGEILVITHNEEALKEEVAKHGGKVVGHIPNMNLYQIEFEVIEAKKLEDLKNTFESYDWVNDAALDYVSEINDAEYQLPDDYPSNDGKYAYESIDAPKAWELMNQIGVDRLYRPEITVMEAGNIDLVAAKDITIKDYHYSDYIDVSNHAINVTGIIAAEHDDYGIPGMVPYSDIDFYCVNKNEYNRDSARMEMSSINVYKILNDVIAKEQYKQYPAILNMSYGSDDLQAGASNDVPGYIDSVNELISLSSSCLKELLDKGYDFLIVKSAGNSNLYTYYLLATGEVINKIDYDKLEQKPEIDKTLEGDVYAYWDKFAGIEDYEIASHIIVVGSSKPGKNSIKASTYHSNGERIDIIAPGQNIVTLTDSTAKGIGTSYSTPFVTGTAGMLLSVNPDLTGPQIKEIILATGTGSYYLGNSSDRAVPHLNSYNAVKEVFNSKYDIDNFEHFSPTIASFDICEKQSESEDFCGYIAYWDLVDGADGYQISYSYGSEKDEETIETEELNTYIPVHSENDNLIVKLRAYKDFNGKKFYTQWSNPINKSSEDIKKEYEDMMSGGFTSVVPVIGEWTNVTVWNDTGIGSIEYRVDWSPVEGAEGYEFFYNFELTVNPEHTVETNDTNYTVGFQNQVNLNGQVRAYKTVNGERVYTQWSNTSYKDWAAIDQECKALAEANTPTTTTRNENWTIKREYQSDASVPELTDEEIEERLRWLSVPEDAVVTVTVDAPYYGDSVNPNGYMQFIEARSDDGSFACASFVVGGDLYQARTIHSYSK